MRFWRSLTLVGDKKLARVCWLAILNHTRRNIDDELGELGGIAGAFAVVSHIHSNAMIIAMAATPRYTSVV
jgi:hypothetical protein